AAPPPRAGVFIGLMDGEEYGLLGSQKLAAKLSTPAGLGGVHMSDLKAVVNLDASSARASDVQDQVKSVAGQDAPLFSWRAMVSSEEPTLTSLFLTTFAAHQVLGLPVTSEVAKATIGGGSWRTDAQWFHEAGVPAAWPVAGYPEYHTDGDLPSAMDKADLAAQAGGLVAAERRVGHRHEAVDADGASAQSVGDAVGALDVVGLDAGAQAVVGVVGDADRLFLVLDGDGRQHRAEDLVLGDRHLVVDIGEQGGDHPVARRQLPTWTGAPEHHAVTLLLALLDIVHHPASRA